uniref:Transposase n=1 Tax=Ditylenchus dipsaci TaxID=166011 RepID=A0A915ER56_9BILA
MLNWVSSKTQSGGGSTKHLISYRRGLTLHAKQGNVPCLHALLPKKSRRTYDHFFAAVQQLIPEARVRHAHMDFEKTLIVAEKHRCFAHLSRALYRRVKKLGLARKYKEVVLSRHCSTCSNLLLTSLSFISPMLTKGLSEIRLSSILCVHGLDVLVVLARCFQMSYGTDLN